MTIRSVSSPYGAQRVASPPATPSAKPAGDAAPTSVAAPRQDSVSISSAGRALAGGTGGATSSSLTPERLAELRKKVYEGAYNSTHVVDTVAKRLLSSGDV